MSLTITFDPKKRAQTLKHRGLDFVDAAEVFAARTATRQDDRKDYGEPRYISAGYLRGRFVVLVWTPRDGARHIISMRRGHGKEEARWREELGGSG
ncbi:MAG: BrnT family toxin [Variibacter sp.]